jgi:uncharacterized protein
VLVGICLILCGLQASAWAAQDVPIPPSPTQFVTDSAGFLSPSDADRLNARLRDYEQQTQHQIIVYIAPTTGEVPIEDWANRAFEAWGVGRKGIDDGVALFIMAKDRRLRIEVGYGLEDKVPDLLANRIIQDTIVPRIRAGDNAGAVESGVEAIAQAIGQPLPGGSVIAPPAQEFPSPGVGQLVTLGIIAVIFLAILGASPGFAIWLLLSLFSGRNRRGPRGGWGGGRSGGGWSGGGGGWSGGGGGFSGGGGMSGGGGASGSW